ncbi:ComEC/Rec2 family competence protein [Kaistella sp. G5-32]|uniref:ComEC/Rec2 family competence protein n=1 Tax=Kaistella gelatinilytica TaxID=2787636 RepID=A0ABS0FER3_9FLAO|nr:ComEC/Rec2 family competence protein [Kaistella gelatinilytica]MBF8458162.1 ComEC/Rec2 family competence protein [Kaistella gelatinilytica]
MFLILCFLSLFVFLVKKFLFYRLRHLSLFLLFFSLGIFAHFLNSQKPQLPDLKSKENIIFKITKKLNSNQKSRRYEIEAWKGNESFKSVLSIPKDEKDFDYLHYYKAEIYINKIEKPYSDFQFDYGKYLGRKGIYFQSYLPNSFRSSKRNDLSFAEKIRQKRLETLSKIDDSNLSKASREFTKGIILADRTEMDKEIVRDFSKSGLVHILAISGSHMAIIFWLILLVLNPVFPPKLKNYKIIISLLLIWSFAIFIDYGSSVVRSCVMISAYYTFILLQRKTDLLHSMAIAGLAILITDTNQLFDVGFQLSFLAVLGIFWFNQPILKYLPKPKNNFQNFFMNIVSISISAQLATLPLVIYYFHQYSFISIIANLVIIPFSEILIIFALLMTVLTAFSLQFTSLNLIYDFCVTYTLKEIHFFAEIDLAFYKIIPLTLLEVFVAFIIIYLLRFAILKFNVKNFLRVTYFVLTFIALRFVLNFKADQIDEVLVHQYFKEAVISVKGNNKVRFIMHENSNPEKIEQFVIEPYLTSRRTKNFEIVQIPRSVEQINIDGVKYILK